MELMDSVLPILCLALGSAIPVALLFFAVQRGVRQLAVAQAYAEVARRLGLEVDTRGVSLQGHLADRRVWIGQVMVGHGTDRHSTTWGVVDLDRPLGLGLLLRRRGLSERLFRRSRAPEATLSNADLARLVEARGDDPSRIRSLLTEEVQQTLAAVMRRWPDVVVTDHSVRVFLKKPEARGDRLQSLVDALLHLASTLEKARRDVDVPERLQAEASGWADLAGALNLDVEPWLPALSGTLEGHRVVLAIRRQSGGYAAELRLRFGAPSDIGLRIRPQVEPDGYWSVGQDIQVGDARFDAAFVVKGYDPLTVRETLNATARDALMVLAATGPVEVDDKYLLVRGLPLSPATLSDLLATALSVARAMGRTAVEG